MSYQHHIDSVLTSFRSWFEEAVRLIQELPPGERLPITVLSERVGAKFGVKGAQVYNVMRFFADDLELPGFKRQRGAKGGWMRETINNQESK